MMSSVTQEQRLAEKLSWPALLFGAVIGLSLFVSGFAIQQRFFQLDISDVMLAYMAGAVIAVLTFHRVWFKALHVLAALCVLASISIYISIEPSMMAWLPSHSCVVIVPIMLGYVSMMLAAHIAFTPKHPEHQQMIWAAIMIGSAIAIALCSYVLLPMFNLYVMLLILLQLMLLGWWLLQPIIDGEIQIPSLTISMKAFGLSFFIAACVCVGVDYEAAEYRLYWASYGLYLAITLMLLGVVFYVLRTQISIITQHVRGSIIALLITAFIVPTHSHQISDTQHHLRTRMIHTIFSDAKNVAARVALWNATAEEYDLVTRYTGDKASRFNTIGDPYDLVIILSASAYEKAVVRWWSEDNLQVIQRQLSDQGVLVLVGKKPMLDRQINTLLDVFAHVDWIRESEDHYVLMASNQEMSHAPASIPDKLKQERYMLGILDALGEGNRWKHSRDLPSRYLQARSLNIVHPQMAFTFDDVVMRTSQEAE